MDRNSRTIRGTGAAFFGALGILSLLIGNFLNALITLSIAAWMLFANRGPETQTAAWEPTPLDSKDAARRADRSG